MGEGLALLHKNGIFAYANKCIAQYVASNTKNTKGDKEKMTYFFNVKDYPGMHSHLFKIVNINLTEEINQIKENQSSVTNVAATPIDYDHLIIAVYYDDKPTELFFFKSIGYGLKKYSEIRKAIGIRI